MCRAFGVGNLRDLKKNNMSIPAFYSLQSRRGDQEVYINKENIYKDCILYDIGGDRGVWGYFLVKIPRTFYKRYILDEPYMMNKDEATGILVKGLAKKKFGGRKGQLQ